VILLLLTDIIGRCAKINVQNGCILMLEWTLITGVCLRHAYVCVCARERKKREGERETVYTIYILICTFLVMLRLCVRFTVIMYY